MAERIRVVLRWVQILDKMEPFYKERGEFRFSSRVSSDSGGRVQETRFPSEGYYEISDHPAWNKLNLDKVIFEGEVDQKMTVEIMGEEIDTLSSNDQLDHYKREFAGSPPGWVGIYGPGDDLQQTAAASQNDPENMSNWRLSYVIERA
jgi:hypothetical protein